MEGRGVKGGLLRRGVLSLLSKLPPCFYSNHVYRKLYDKVVHLLILYALYPEKSILTIVLGRRVGGGKNEGGRGEVIEGGKKKDDVVKKKGGDDEEKVGREDGEVDEQRVEEVLGAAKVTMTTIEERVEAIQSLSR